MSSFHKLSHTLWHCQYHIVWVPKYRYRVLEGPVREATYKGVHAICGYSGSEVVEMNVQKDHVHLVVMVPPKISISDLMGRLKGQTAIKTFKQFPHLRQKPYWGNHFWSKGYCVDTVGLDEEMIRKYVKYQEEKDQYIDQTKFGFKTQRRHNSCQPPQGGMAVPPYRGLKQGPVLWAGLFTITFSYNSVSFQFFDSKAMVRPWFSVKHFTIY